MACLLLESFDDDLFSSRWTNVGNFSLDAAIPRTGPQCALFASGMSYLDLGAADEDDSMIVAAAFRADSGCGQHGIDYMGDAGTVLHLRFMCDPATRSAYVQRGDGTILEQTAPNAFELDEYNQWQFEAFIDDLIGTWEVVLNGSQVVLSGIGDTRNGGVDPEIDRIGLRNLGGGASNPRVDDVQINNTAGLVNNSLPGDVRIYVLFPSGAGDVTDLTPTGSANNWENVDENPPSIADYNGSATVGDIDTYGMQDLPVAVGVIKAVEVATFAFKSDAGAKQGRRIIRRAATDDPGPDLALSTSPIGFIEVMNEDPHGGPGAWTIAALNATQAGFEVRT